MANDISKSIKAKMKLGISASISNPAAVQKEFDKLGKITIHPKIDQRQLDSLLKQSIARSTELSLKIQDVHITKTSLQSALDKASTNVKLNVVKFNFDQNGIQTALNDVAKKAEFTLYNVKLDLNAAVKKAKNKYTLSVKADIGNQSALQGKITKAFNSSVEKFQNKIDSYDYKVNIKPDEASLRIARKNISAGLAGISEQQRKKLSTKDLGQKIKNQTIKFKAVLSSSSIKMIAAQLESAWSMIGQGTELPIVGNIFKQIRQVKAETDKPIKIELVGAEQANKLFTAYSDALKSMSNSIGVFHKQFTVLYNDTQKYTQATDMYAASVTRAKEALSGLDKYSSAMKKIRVETSGKDRITAESKQVTSTPINDDAKSAKGLRDRIKNLTKAFEEAKSVIPAEKLKQFSDIMAKIPAIKTKEDIDSITSSVKSLYSETVGGKTLGTIIPEVKGKEKAIQRVKTEVLGVKRAADELPKDALGPMQKSAEKLVITLNEAGNAINKVGKKGSNPPREVGSTTKKSVMDKDIAAASNLLSSSFSDLSRRGANVREILMKMFSDMPKYADTVGGKIKGVVGEVDVSIIKLGAMFTDKLDKMKRAAGEAGLEFKDFPQTVDAAFKAIQRYGKELDKTTGQKKPKYEKEFVKAAKDAYNVTQKQLVIDTKIAEKKEEQAKAAAKILALHKGDQGAQQEIRSKAIPVGATPDQVKEKLQFTIAEQLERERARVQKVITGINEEYTSLVTSINQKKKQLQQAAPGIPTDKIKRDINELARIKKNMDMMFKKGFTFDVTLNKAGEAIQRITSTYDRNGKVLVSTSNNVKASIDTLSGGWRNMMKRIAGYGAGSMIFYSMIRGVKFAIKSIDDFEQKMAKMRMIMHPVKTDFDEMGKSAFNMASKYGTSISEVMDAMVVFAQQGREQNEVISLVETSLLAANVTTLKAKEATEYLTAAVLQFNKSADQSIDFLDKWVNVASKNAVTAKVLAEATKRVGVSARLAGLDIDYFNGMVTAISAATRKSGKEVGTGLRYIFRQFRRDKAVKALQDSGVAVFASGMKTMKGLKGVGTSYRSLQTVIQELAGKWKDLNQVQKENIASALGGRRHYNVIKVLFENYDKAIKATSDSQNSWGSALSKNQIIMKTFSKTIEQIKVSFQELVVNLGSSGAISFLDMFKGASKVLGGILKIVTDLLSPFKSLISIAGSAALAIGGIGAAMRRMGMNGMSLGGMIGKVKEYDPKSQKSYTGFKAKKMALAGQTAVAPAFGPQTKDITRQQKALSKLTAGTAKYRMALGGLNRTLIAQQGGWSKFRLALGSIKNGIGVVKGRLKSMAKFLMGPGGLAIMVAVMAYNAFKKSLDTLNNSAEKYIKTSKEEIDKINARIASHNKMISILQKEQVIRDKMSKSKSGIATDDSKRQLDLIDKIAQQFPKLVVGYNKYGKAILDSNYLLDDGRVNIKKITEDSNKLQLDTKLKKATIELEYIRKLYKDIEGGKGFLNLGDSDVEDLQDATRDVKNMSEAMKILQTNNIKSLDFNTDDMWKTGDLKDKAKMFEDIRERILGIGGLVQHMNFKRSAENPFLTGEGQVEAFRTYLAQDLAEKQKELEKYRLRLNKVIGNANKTVGNIVSKLGGGRALSMFLNRKIKGGESFFSKFLKIEIANASRLFRGQKGGKDKATQTAYINLYNRFIPNRDVLIAHFKGKSKELNQALSMMSFFDFKSVFSNIMKNSSLQGGMKDLGIDMSSLFGTALKDDNVADLGKLWSKAWEGSAPKKEGMNKDAAFKDWFTAQMKNRAFFLNEQVKKNGKLVTKTTKVFMDQNGKLTGTGLGGKEEKGLTMQRVMKGRVRAVQMKSDKPDGRYILDLTKRSKLMEGMIGLLGTQIDLVDKYNKLLKENLSEWQDIYTIGDQTSESIESLADIKVGTSVGMARRVAPSVSAAAQFTRQDIGFGELDIDISRQTIALDFLKEVNKQYDVLTSEAKMATDVNTEFFNEGTKGYKSLTDDMKKFSQISGVDFDIDKLLPSKQSVQKRSKEIYSSWKKNGVMKIINAIETPFNALGKMGLGKKTPITTDKQFKNSADRLAKEEAINKAVEERNRIEMKALSNVVKSYDNYILKLEKAEGSIANQIARTKDPVKIQLLSAQQLVYQLQRQQLELSRTKSVAKLLNKEFENTSLNLIDVSRKLAGNTDFAKRFQKVNKISPRELMGVGMGQIVGQIFNLQDKRASATKRAVLGVIKTIRKLKDEQAMAASGTSVSEHKKEWDKLQSSLITARKSLGQIRERIRKINEEAKKMRVDAMKSFVKAFDVETKDISMFSDAGIKTIGTRFNKMRSKIFNGIDAVYGKGTDKARVAKKRFFQALSKPLPFSSANIDKMYAKLASPARYKKYLKGSTDVAAEQVKIIDGFLKKAVDLGLDFDKELSRSFTDAGFDKDIVSPQTLAALKQFGSSLKEIAETASKLRLASQFSKMNMEISKLDAQMAVYGQSWQHLDKTVSAFRSTLDGIINKSVEHAGSWENVDAVTKSHIHSLKNELTVLEEIKAKNDLIKNSFSTVGKILAENVLKGKSLVSGLGAGLKQARQQRWVKGITGEFEKLAGILSKSGSAETKKFKKAHAQALKLEKLINDWKKKKLIDMNKEAADVYINHIASGFAKEREKANKRMQKTNDDALVKTFKDALKTKPKKESKSSFGMKMFKTSVVNPLVKDLKDGKLTIKEFVKEVNRQAKLLSTNGVGIDIKKIDPSSYVSSDVYQSATMKKMENLILKNIDRGGGISKTANVRTQISGMVQAIYSQSKTYFATRGAGVEMAEKKAKESTARFIESLFKGKLGTRMGGIYKESKKSIVGQQVVSPLSKDDKSFIKDIMKTRTGSKVSLRVEKKLRDDKTAGKWRVAGGTEYRKLGFKHAKEEGKRVADLYKSGKITWTRLQEVLKQLYNHLKSSKVGSTGIGGPSLTARIKKNIAEINKSAKPGVSEKVKKTFQKEFGYGDKKNKVTTTNALWKSPRGYENESRRLASAALPRLEKELVSAKDKMDKLNFQHDPNADMEPYKKQKEKVEQLKKYRDKAKKVLKPDYISMDLNQNKGFFDLMSGNYGKGPIGKESAGTMWDRLSGLSKNVKGSALTLGGETKTGFVDQYHKQDKKVYKLMEERTRLEQDRVIGVKDKDGNRSGGVIDKYKQAESIKDKEKRDKELARLKKQYGFSSSNDIAKYSTRLTKLNKEFKEGTSEASTFGQAMSQSFKIVGQLIQAKIETKAKAVLFGGSSANVGNDAVKGSMTKHATRAGSDEGQFGMEVGRTLGTAIGKTMGPVGEVLGPIAGELLGGMIGGLFADGDLIDAMNAVKDAQLELYSTQVLLAEENRQTVADLTLFRQALSPVSTAFSSLASDFGKGLKGGAVQFMDIFNAVDISGTGFNAIEGFSDRAFASSLALNDLVMSADTAGEAFRAFADTMVEFQMFIDTANGTGSALNTGGLIDQTFEQMSQNAELAGNKNDELERTEALVDAQTGLVAASENHYEDVKKDNAKKWKVWVTDEDEATARKQYLDSMEQLNQYRQDEAALREEINKITQENAELVAQMADGIHAFAEAVNDARSKLMGTTEAWGAVISAVERNVGSTLDVIFNNLIDNLGNLTLDFIAGFDNSLFNLDSLTVEGITQSLESGDTDLMDTTGVNLTTMTGDLVALMGTQFAKVAQLDQSVAEQIGDKSVGEIIKLYKEYQYEMIKNISDGQKFYIEMLISKSTLGFTSLAFTAKDYYDILEKTSEALTSSIALMIEGIKEAIDEFKMTATSFREEDFMSRFTAGENVLDIYKDLSENGTRSIQLLEENARGQLVVAEEAKAFYQEQANLIAAQASYSSQQEDMYGEKLQLTFADTGLSTTLQAAFASGVRALTSDELKSVTGELYGGGTLDEEAQLNLFKEFYSTYLDSANESNSKAQELIDMSKEANDLLYQIQKAYQDEYTKPSTDRLAAEENLRALRNLQHSIDSATGNVLYTSEGEVNKISEAEYRAIKEIDPSAQIATTLEEFDKIWGTTIQEGPSDISTYTSVRPITYNTNINVEIEALDTTQMSPTWKRELALTIQKEFETMSRNFSGNN